MSSALRTSRARLVRRQADRFASRQSASAFEVLGLESRVMMHADPNDPNHFDEIPENLVAPVVTANPSNGGSSTTGSVAASSPLSSVPALSSRPSAYAKIYLDFTGDSTPTWGSYTPGTTPAYDTDGDPTTFSDAELTSIREIFNRVSEKYSPFNIDVTTTNPGNLTNGRTLKVVVGGDGAWLGAQAGGVSYVGSFANSAPNVAFVFPKMLGNGYAKYTAEAVAHESGHAFDLQHQSQYDAAGNKLNEYAPANAAGDAPIMGNSYTARRGLWWYGPDSDGYTQDDLATISSTTNGFGYRADDFGSTLATASALTLSGGTTASTAGVVEKTSDLDVFSFTTGAGAVTFNANPYAIGGMADLKLQLVDASGAVVASADNGLAETLTASVAAGTYYVEVGSHGSYGDVGQYTLTGTVIAPVAQPQPIVPAGATNLTVRNLTSTSNRLTWTDNADNETGFKVYSSRDGRTWTYLGAVGANTTSVDNTGLRKNVTYYYKVTAYNAIGDAPESNVGTVKTALTAATTVAGDATLDGVVDFNDLVKMSQNYNTTSGMTWQQGDFNGDGAVDFNDLVVLSQNYNTSPYAADVPSDGTDLGQLTAVPLTPIVTGTTGSTTSSLTTTTANATTTSKTTVKAKPTAVTQPKVAARPVAKTVAAKPATPAVFSLKPIARTSLVRA